MSEVVDDPVIGFRFGKNWKDFITSLGEAQILEAEKSLVLVLGYPLELGPTERFDLGQGLLRRLACGLFGAIVQELLELSPPFGHHALAQIRGGSTELGR